MSKKITYIISQIDKAIAFEWICENIDKDKFILEFIIINSKKGHFEQYCTENNIKVKSYILKGKKSYPRIFLCLLFYFIKNRPDTVHTHLFEANILGLLAAKVTFIKNRIYTRHHSTFHHEYFPKAIKWDRLSNRLCTRIVAISQVVKDTLIVKENVPERKTSLIHHGFKLDDFKKINTDEIEFLEKKYNKEKKGPIIGVIARFTKLKGIQYIIPAFKDFLTTHPNAKLLLFNANGEYKQKIDYFLSKLPKGSYETVVFENNILSLYHIFDIYVHVPINKSIEAFGQTYIEALASGVPSIFTLSGIANEFIYNHENAIVVPYCNSNSIKQAMIKLMEDKCLRENLKDKGYKSINNFTLETMMQKLEKLYE